MDFDRERELEDAGIDAFEFSMMDASERRAVLRDNFLDPDDYDMIDLEPEFQAWENLQSAGLSLSELSYMDDCEKKAALEDAGLDADDYGVDPGYYHYSYVSRSKPAEKKPAPKLVKSTPAKPSVQAKSEPTVRKVEPVPAKPKPAEKIFPTRLYFYCGVKLPYSDHIFWYLTGDLDLEVGDRVEVPLGATDDPVTGEVVSVRTGTESDLPFSPKDAKYVSRIVKTKNGGIYTSTGQVAHSVGDLNPKPKEYSNPGTMKTDRPADLEPDREISRKKGGKKEKRRRIRTVLAWTVFFVLLYGLIAWKMYYDNQKEMAAVAHAEEMYQRGQIEFAKGSYSEARKCFYESEKKNIGDSNAWYYLTMGMQYAEKHTYSSARKYLEKAADYAKTEEVKQKAEVALRTMEIEEKQYEEEQQRKHYEELAKSLPYVGMSERDISKTALGSPSATVRHNYEMVSGEQVLANLYDYTKNGYVIYTARCVNGRVTDVWDRRSNPYKQSSGTSSKKDSGKEKKTDGKYPASNYVHPDDFYYDYYDDFYDYEEAEEYWEEYG